MTKTTLGKICTFNYGKALPASERSGSGFSVYGSNGIVGQHGKSLTTGKTIIIGRKGSYGEINYSEKPCWPIDTAYFIDESCTNQDIRWLSHRLATMGLNKMNKSAAVPGLNREDAYRLELLLPSISEQRRIAAILDQADALRAKSREALAELDGLAQAIFVEMFGDSTKNTKGWDFATINDCAVVQGGLQVTSTRKSIPQEVPYLRVANVYRGFLNLSEIKTIRATSAEISRTTLITDDLLVVEGHGNPNEIGRSALWTGEIKGCVHQNHIIRVRFDQEKIVPKYACEYLNSPGGRLHLLRAGKTTSGLNTISVSNVRETPIAVPPKNLQHIFAARIQALESLKATHRTALTELDALFASLQHRAFRGEL